METNEENKQKINISFLFMRVLSDRVIAFWTFPRVPRVAY